jgi:OCT family organic cation transporter-like MFS transporter 4/5
MIASLEILNQIAVVNKKEPLHLDSLRSVALDKSGKIFSIIDLFRYPSIRVLSYAASFVFFAIQAVYYGVTFTMSTIGIDVFTNTAIIASAETLAYCISNSVIPLLPRKLTVFSGLFLAALVSCSFVFLKPPPSC